MLRWESLSYCYSSMHVRLRLQPTSDGMYNGVHDPSNEVFVFCHGEDPNVKLDKQLCQRVLAVLQLDVAVA